MPWGPEEKAGVGVRECFQEELSLPECAGVSQTEGEKGIPGRRDSMSTEAINSTFGRGVPCC